MLLLVSPADLFLVMGIMLAWILITAFIEYLIVRPFRNIKGLFRKPDSVSEYRRKLGYDDAAP